jgi:DNA-binding CsgD family transcriptional regulator
VNRKYVSRSSGSLHFNGFQWICPVCEKCCGTIYYPARAVNVLERAQPKIAQLVEMKWKLKGFACARCHGVNFCSAILRNSWNEFVGYLTAGLLYGREVPRPGWFKPQRKVKYAPRPMREPSRRRQQVLELIVRGLTYRQIAAELGLKRATVDWHATIIFKQHGVHKREELARKIGARGADAQVNDRISIASG